VGDNKGMITIDHLTVTVFDGNNLPVFAQEMFDQSDVQSFKEMLEDNPDLPPFDCFCEWLRFRFPDPQGVNRLDRTVPSVRIF
jgi:hypothetical protein